ncbi:MAG: hypothetical protein JWP44_2404 [Mucilaginibacter sp.]|nr:hypothetical protein [Mucilaginibacter sp.]
MKNILTVSCLLMICFAATAQNSYQNYYDASIIPKELLPYASAVIRNEEISNEVKDLDNTIYHVKRVITILNQNGDSKLDLDVSYDKITSIRYIKGLIYNEYGKPVGKITERDFDDYAETDGFSLFIDDRVKHYKKAVAQYPYTIEYEYELKSKQSLAFADWMPNNESGVAIEKSAYTFICPPEFTMRYKQFNLPSNVTVGKNKDLMKTYTWQVTGMKARRDEPFSSYPEKLVTRVTVAPQKFTYYGVTGSFTSWKELGKWLYDQLLVPRQQLPPETIEHVKEITKDISDPKLKAKRIYEYMQEKTHYVSVQMGIGGIQPFPASDVDKQNYGDCKALVNYTQALLKAVNINSYYCVVKSGRNYNIGMMDDFPSINQGDHIILCIPFKNDTTWADCTSQTIPFGYLGKFTDDRTVLACTSEGGKLIHTPKYNTITNLENRKASFVIDNDGGLAGSMQTIFKGAEYENREYFINESQTKQYKFLQKQYPINNLTIDHLDFKQDKSFDPVTIENVKLHARDYASLSDGKYYFMLNAGNRITEPPKQLRNRQNDVYITRGRTNEDEINYTVPAGYRLEKVPLNVSIEKPFGKFTATMSLNGNKLTYKRKFQLIDGTYNKDTYQELVDFYQSVADADEYSVVLIK